MLRLRLMAENGNLNNNNFDNFNNTPSAREFINRSTTSTDINSATTSLNERTTTGYSERDATHFRLRDGVIDGLENLTCLSCGEIFKSSTLIEVYDHFRERPHNTYYANCFYCQGKVHQYYHNRKKQLKYYHNCLGWKRGDDQ